MSFGVTLTRRVVAVCLLLAGSAGAVRASAETIRRPSPRTSRGVPECYVPKGYAPTVANMHGPVTEAWLGHIMRSMGGRPGEVGAKTQLNAVKHLFRHKVADAYQRLVGQGSAPSLEGLRHVQLLVLRSRRPLGRGWRSRDCTPCMRCIACSLRRSRSGAGVPRIPR